VIKQHEDNRTTGMVRFHRQHLQSVSIFKLLQEWFAEAGHLNPLLTKVLFNNKCYPWIQIHLKTSTWFILMNS